MIEGSSDRNRSGRPGWGTWLYSKRESVWYVLAVVIPFLTLKLLMATNETVNNIESTGQFTYPGGYVAIAIITLLLCAVVPFLLRESESEFKMGGIALTSVIPAIAVIWVWVAMVNFAEEELAYKTADPIGRYFVTRRAYNVYTYRYADAEKHKAIAQSAGGAWAWTANHSTATEAAEVALDRCTTRNEKPKSEQPCKITTVSYTHLTLPTNREV